MNTSYCYSFEFEFVFLICPFICVEINRGYITADAERRKRQRTQEIKKDFVKTNPVCLETGHTVILPFKVSFLFSNFQSYF